MTDDFEPDELSTASGISNAIAHSALIWALVALGVLFACWPAHAGEVQPPPGAVAFCLRLPSECATANASAAAANQIGLIDRINISVNRRIRPEDDAQHYGRPEFWALADDGNGDCEDYALAKLYALRAAGIPAGAMVLARVVLQNQHAHMVALVRVGDQTYVLDNLTDAVDPIADVNYYWIERQDWGRPQTWVAMQ